MRGGRKIEGRTLATMEKIIVVYENVNGETGSMDFTFPKNAMHFALEMLSRYFIVKVTVVFNQTDTRVYQKEVK